MTFTANTALYVALVLYGVGTLAALVSLLTRQARTQRTALVVMLLGFVSHTIWIGTICVRTGHPPLTNLPETAAFTSWTLFAVELLLFLRYRVQAASFFVYPLVLGLLMLAAIVREPFARLDPTLRSGLFITHIFLSSIGVAGLLTGIGFTLLAYAQDRSLKSKTRGRLWEMIPSLTVCRDLSYRALAIGFGLYTFGILAGVIWSYRTTAELLSPRAKEVAALVAWLCFAALLQSYLSGSYRARRTIVLSMAAFVAIVVSMLGIHHG